MLKLSKTKSLIRLTKEWDSIAAIRDEQVSSGKDHSANSVLSPAILSNLPKVDRLIDIGCGTGWLTERAGDYANSVTGIDPSTESIQIARMRHSSESISYHSSSIEAYSREVRKFDLAISNMAASSAPDIESFFSSSRHVLKKNSLLVFTIPHPCFWPLYWGYATHPEFNYQESYAIEGEFKIQKETTKLLTTHFHHPLEKYLEALNNSHFQVEKFSELMGQGFKFPRFILIKARAI